MLEGDIREINLVERLVELWREKFTGALRFEHDGIIKIIYFKDGDVLSASTNDRADSVDEILMKAGKVSKEHVKQALAKRKESETLGDALLILGFITRKELTWGRRMQVISVIRSVSEWTGGSFTIVENYLPKREEGTIFSLPQLIVEMTVTEQDRSKFEKSLQSGSAVLEKAPGFDESFRALGLNEEAEAVVRNIDGTRTASEVAASSRQDVFNSYKLMHALTVLGLLFRRQAAAPPADDDYSFEKAGVADAADAWAMPQFQVADESPAPPAPPITPPPSATIEMPAPKPEPKKMPAWQPPAPLVVEEEKWGFDEAQIEAAKTVTVPLPPPLKASPPPPTPARVVIPPSPRSDGTSTRRRTTAAPPPEKKSRFGLLVALMVVFILAGVAYGAFYWWNAKQAATPQPPLRTTPTAEVKPRPAPPAQVVTESTSTIAPTALVPTVSAPTPVVPAVVTPTGAEVAATPVQPRPAATRQPGGDLRVRYDAMARDFALNPNGSFTVQFAIMCEPSNLSNALQTGGAKVWFLPISLRERACYRLFWGRYDTRAAAESAIGEIPRSLRGASSAVVSIPR